MTCIVGLVDADSVWISGDSAGVARLDLVVRADQKVWRKGKFVYGFTSSFRMGQLLRYSLTVPEQYPSQGVEEYMVGPFIDAARRCLKDGGFAETHDGAERGGTFLVGYAGRLFEIGSDYQVGESVDGFAAVGCGDSYALGSLYSTGGEPRSRVQLALESAEAFSAGVRSPFVILKGGTNA